MPSANDTVSGIRSNNCGPVCLRTTSVIILTPCRTILQLVSQCAGERQTSEPGSISGRVSGSLPDLRKWESCRMIPLVDGFFSETSRFSRPLILMLLHCHLFSPFSALKASFHWCGPPTSRVPYQSAAISPADWTCPAGRYLVRKRAEATHLWLQPIRGMLTGPASATPAAHGGSAALEPRHFIHHAVCRMHAPANTPSDNAVKKELNYRTHDLPLPRPFLYMVKLRHYRTLLQNSMDNSTNLTRKGAKLDTCELQRHYGVPKGTLEKYIKNKGTASKQLLEMTSGRKPVRPPELENLLVRYCMELDERYFSLTVADVKRMAFELAIRNGLSHPFNPKKKSGRKKRLRLFMKRHPGLSLRTPQERGAFVTCLNATGNYVPPLSVYPRKNMKAELMDGAPPGSISACHISGWIQTDIFSKWFDHFVEFTKSTVRAKPLKKTRKSKPRKRSPSSSSNLDVGAYDDAECLFCTGLFSEGRREKKWAQCCKCRRWAHKEYEYCFRCRNDDQVYNHQFTGASAHLEFVKRASSHTPVILLMPLVPSHCVAHFDRLLDCGRFGNTPGVKFNFAGEQNQSNLGVATPPSKLLRSCSLEDSWSDCPEDRPVPAARAHYSGLRTTSISIRFVNLLSSVHVRAAEPQLLESWSAQYFLSFVLSVQRPHKNEGFLRYTMNATPLPFHKDKHDKFPVHEQSSVFLFPPTVTGQH
ncbi:hypothetical protein PR048_003024 [Dryococelus australis]|uniref:Transposase n=1 Tax=Dryococelus australis TaxID=614101 RepID=A0ABQ9IM08_9NEOP|nr:hypothetical protein PR048_003024 [Dryococelus australis]